MRLLTGFGCLLMLTACATEAPSPASAPTVAPAAVAKPAAVAQPAAQPVAAAADPNKKICRRMTMTGSNMPNNVCATAAEWAQRDKIAQQGNDDLDRERRSGSRSFRGE